ncbi:PEP-CTERM sorting domain-containing protein [Vibrio tritonius]|uniref:PEP-CTERM sorting domain-containing protein n=1 Tax=Vibrio tritonius TaxID=1435069 RepID=UPI000837B22C|nr:PEP-CTERM sorting domain-containing protein [Vibrio tritonius]
MKLFKKLGQLLMLCLFIGVSTQAYSSTLDLTNMVWGIDYDHDGNPDNTTTYTNDLMGFFGYTLVEFDSPSTAGTLSDGDTFTDYNYLKDTTSGSGIYTTNTMTGKLADTTGTSIVYSTAEFDAGSTMTWYDANNSNASILTLDVYEGSSTLKLDDGILTIDQIKLLLSVTSVAEDYFYVKVNDKWVDLYDILNGDSYSEIYLYVLVSSDVPSSIEDADTLTDYVNDQTGSDLDNLDGYLTDTAETTEVDLSQAAENNGNGGYSYMIVNNGTSIVRKRVPEPGMLSLMGLAFLGLAGLQRRRKMQSGTNTKLN